MKKPKVNVYINKISKRPYGVNRQNRERDQRGQPFGLIKPKPSIIQNDSYRFDSDEINHLSERIIYDTDGV